MRQQISVSFGNVEVIGLNRDCIENRFYEVRPLLLPAAFRHLDTNSQLRHGDRCDRDVIAVVNYFLQRVAAALGVD